MSDLATRSNGHRSRAELAQDRAEAVAMIRADPAVSDAELMARFGNEARWVRARRAEARAGGTETRDRPARPAHRTATTAAPVVHQPASRPLRAGVPRVDAVLVVRVLAGICAGGLACIALLQSYTHIHHLAVLAQVTWPRLLPLAVDGLMGAGALCLTAERLGRKQSRPDTWVAVGAIAVGFVGSVIMNILARRPDLVDLETVGLILAAAVPVAAVWAVELVLRVLFRR